LATFSSVCHRVVGALGANGVMVEVAFALKVYSLDNPIVQVRNMRKKATVLVTACVMILVVVFFEFYVFGASTKRTTSDPYSAAYYDEFNKTPTPSYNYSFSPPVSMYRALIIALESGGWNAESLKNMRLYVELDYDAFYENLSTPSGWMTLGNDTFRTSPPATGFALLYPVTQPPVDWSPQKVDNVTYRYVWTIIVQYSKGFGIPPPGYYYVDAATAELVSTDIL